MVDEIDNLEDFVSLNDDRGVLKKIIKEGSGVRKPLTEDNVYIHYVGTYHGGKQHGKQFDSSRDRNEPFKFKIGRSEVIKGWDLAIPTMKIGEICELIVFPDYAYFDKKTLKFVIELLDFRGGDITDKRDRTITMSHIKRGSTYVTPYAGSDVTVSLKGFYNDTVFDDRKFTYVAGDYWDANIPIGLDIAIGSMSQSSVAIVTVSSYNSFSEAQSKHFNIPVGSKLVYEVEVHSFAKVSNIQNILSFVGQINYLEKRRLRANEYSKVGKLSLAKDMYLKISEEFLYIVTRGIQQKEILEKQSIIIFLNIAFINIKEKNHKECIKYCDKALNLDASNEKALFRKGQAFILQGDYEEALTYFRRIAKANPENSAAVNQVKICENIIKRVNEKERNMFRSAFKRLEAAGFTTSEFTKTNESIPTFGVDSAVT